MALTPDQHNRHAAAEPYLKSIGTCRDALICWQTRRLFKQTCGLGCGSCLYTPLPQLPASIAISRRPQAAADADSLSTAQQPSDAGTPRRAGCGADAAGQAARGQGLVDRARQRSGGSWNTALAEVNTMMLIGQANAEMRASICARQTLDRATRRIPLHAVTAGRD